MKRTPQILALVLLLLLCPLQVVYAGDINQPTHLPNNAMNKINQVRLKGLTARIENENAVSREFQNIGIGRIEQLGCNLNLGNTIVSSGNLSGDRDVIITGDVINYCEQ
ncbi:MAG: hypothetical protein KZQ93_16175 [Candidatus Thiodiazotropha sp. (ex Monitilora ramsayi)]|nr:hypothetical protein [Candidatus Thiodiazotropha sp. (ex Monitilora ramsayi)]